MLELLSNSTLRWTEKKNKTRARVSIWIFLACWGRFLTRSIRFDSLCALRVRSYRRLATHWTLQTCPSQQTSLTQRRDAMRCEPKKKPLQQRDRCARERKRERERELASVVGEASRVRERERERTSERAKPVCQMPQDATVATVCQSVKLIGKSGEQRLKQSTQAPKLLLKY